MRSNKWRLLGANTACVDAFGASVKDDSDVDGNGTLCTVALVDDEKC